jgi:hypothetical protein
MSAVFDQPGVPAAYPIVAGILGPEWFASPTPTSGVRLAVIGPDSAATYWFVSPFDAERVRRAIEGHPSVRVADCRPYTNERRAS